MRHRFDFYKPVMRSVFPVVDGPLSISCYKEALLSCYSGYRRKWELLRGNQVCVVPEFFVNSHSEAKSNSVDFCEEAEVPGTTLFSPFDYFCFHSPFCRLVAKSFGWLTLEDVRRVRVIRSHGNSAETSSLTTKLSSFLDVPPNESSRELDTACVEASKAAFEAKVKPGLLIASQVGNMYTASLYASLISLVCSIPVEKLRGRRIGMYAYGSGYTASMFSLTVSPELSSEQLTALFGVGSSSSPIERLTSRTPVTPAEFQVMLNSREASVDQAPYEPPFDEMNYFPGTYYLKKVDNMHRRFYQRIPPA